MYQIHSVRPRRRRRAIGFFFILVSAWALWSVWSASAFDPTADERQQQRKHGAESSEHIAQRNGEVGEKTLFISREEAISAITASPVTAAVSTASFHGSAKANGVGTLAIPVPRPQFATLHTSHGPIYWELHPADAPKTVANIVRMSRIGVFNHSCFYRYERGFVLQGGLNCNRRETRIKGAKNAPFEYKRPNEKLTVALARAGGDLSSGGTEFFINTANNTRALGPQKKGGYAVFATVVGKASMETIQRIKGLKTVRKRLTLFVDPQPVIYFIEITDALPAGADGADLPRH